MVEMQVTGLTLDEETKAPILMLHSQDAGLNLQIIVAPLEGMSISMALHQLGSRRSFTHELALRMLDVLNAKLLAVEIYQFKPGVFNADLLLESRNGATTRLDSRPADAVVLALGAKIPILVSKELLTDQGSTELPGTKSALRFKHLAPPDSLKPGAPQAAQNILPVVTGNKQSGDKSLAGPETGAPGKSGDAAQAGQPNIRKKFSNITISLAPKPGVEEPNRQSGTPDVIKVTKMESAVSAEDSNARTQQSAAFDDEEKRWQDILNNFEPISKYKM